MNLKKIIKRKLFGFKSDSESYVNYLKSKGVQVGKGVQIYRPFNTTIDLQNPHMLKIGDFVQMTGPVTILTHDYSWSVLKAVYGKILGNQRETFIGNNSLKKLRDNKPLFLNYDKFIEYYNDFKK